MSESKSDRRKLKRQIRRYLGGRIEPERIDYHRRLQPVIGKSKLLGALSALAVYGLGFAATVYGWRHGVIEDALFERLTWIGMFPSTVIGVSAWLIIKNRLEFPIREDIRSYIRQLEADRGLLWRFGPLWGEEGDTTAVSRRRLVDASREGRIADLDPEDYSKALLQLWQNLNDASDRGAQDALRQVAANLRPT